MTLKDKYEYVAKSLDVEDVTEGDFVFGRMSYCDKSEYSILNCVPGFRNAEWLEYDGWKIGIGKIGNVCNIYVDDTGKSEDVFTNQQLASLCREKGIKIKFNNIHEEVIAFTETLEENCNCCDVVAGLSAIFQLEAASKLCIKAGNAFMDLLVVKDTHEDEFVYNFHDVFMYHEDVYDIMHGYLGVNVYEYLEMLFENNKGIRFDKMKSYLNPNFTHYLSDDEKKFWEVAIKSRDLLRIRELFVKAKTAYLKRKG